MAGAARPIKSRSSSGIISGSAQASVKDKKIDIISESLLKIVREESFTNINLDTKNLLDFEKYPDNAIVMAVALQHEEFSQEYNSSIKKYSGFYDAYFQIIFYDFSDRSLIAAIPFEFEIPILSSNKLDEKNILKRINNFYLKDQPFKQIVQIINRYIYICQSCIMVYWIITINF